MNWDDELEFNMGPEDWDEGERPHLWVFASASDEYGDGAEYDAGPAPDRLHGFGLGPCCICGDWNTVGIVAMPISRWCTGGRHAASASRSATTATRNLVTICGITRVK